MPMSKLAKDRNVSTMTISRAVKELEKKFYFQGKSHILTDGSKALRLERCSKILRLLKTCQVPALRFFCDEKVFHVYAPLKPQERQADCRKKFELVPKFHSKHPAR
ncbi:Uncharacterized protein FKW44_006199 [Caligus rogercresseyi]|uniref:Uncharacterized protein n=1 Tax=Caligus rogercresseyi TaxID=217165 RepID=A0A7T8KD11_CALRO|nr:Uncharacterized protein FKW44_006199 [Caligus rogercresseyi]